MGAGLHCFIGKPLQYNVFAIKCRKGCVVSLRAGTRVTGSPSGSFTEAWASAAPCEEQRWLTGRRAAITGGHSTSCSRTQSLHPCYWYQPSSCRLSLARIGSSPLPAARRRGCRPSQRQSPRGALPVGTKGLNGGVGVIDPLKVAINEPVMCSTPAKTIGEGRFKICSGMHPPLEGCKVKHYSHPFPAFIRSRNKTPIIQLSFYWHTLYI